MIYPRYRMPQLWKNVVLCGVLFLWGAHSGQAAPQTTDTQQQELNCYRTEGIAAYQAGNADAAEKAFREGYARALALHNKKMQGAFLINLGYVKDAPGTYEEARALFDQAVTLEEEAGARDVEIKARLNLTNILLLTFQYEKAADAGKLGVQRSDWPGITPDSLLIKAQLLNNVGVAYMDMENYNPALDYLSRARNLYERQQVTFGVAKILSNMGNLYQYLGDNEAALEFQQKALRLAEQVRDQLKAQAASTKDASEHQQTLYLVGEAENDVTACLLNLGNVYRAMGQFDAAEQRYKQAQPHVEAGQDLDLQAKLLTYIGSVFVGKKQWPQALEAYAQAKKRYVSLNDLYSIAEMNCNMGATYENLHQLDTAALAYKEALASFRAVGSLYSVATCLYGLGVIYEEQHNHADAEEAYREAMTDGEELAAQAADIHQFVKSQQANLGDVYARYAFSLVEHDPAAALAVLERGRSRGLARQIAENHVPFDRLFSAEDARIYRDASENINVAARTYQAVLAHDSSSPALAEAKQKYDLAEATFQQTRSRLFTQYPQFQKIQGQEPPTSEQLTALATAHPESLYLTWAIGEEHRSLCFALSAARGLEVFKLPFGRLDWEKKVRNWRNLIRSQSPQESAAAQELYRDLLGPLEAAGAFQTTGISRLVIVPEGSLSDLPFMALLDSSGHRLIDRYPISTASSLGVLTWQQELRKAEGTLLCAANPMGEVKDTLKLTLRHGLVRFLERCRKPAPLRCCFRARWFLRGRGQRRARYSGVCATMRCFISRPMVLPTCKAACAPG